MNDDHFYKQIDLPNGYLKLKKNNDTYNGLFKDGFLLME